MQSAVFAKNYLRHLEAAVEISEGAPDQLIPFRSSRRWAEANRLLQRSGSTVPILFGVVDRGPEVFYRARLLEVILGPTPRDARSQQLLHLRTITTRDEDWWSEGAKTFYVISRCHELERPIPYADLLKQADGTPLSDDFKYAYALVTISDMSATIGERVASDVVSPPARIDAVVSRVVRDTALTRQLKALHDDRCQLCELRLPFPEGRSYSEAHHLKPLGGRHNGPDISANIVVLCPNCHALCDHGALALVRSALRTAPSHEIGDEFLEYHNSVLRRRTVR
jgi:hypothetical protein